MIFSVKAGNLAPTYVRDLRGVLERESAEIGVLLAFRSLPPGCAQKRRKPGSMSHRGAVHPRIQLRTIRELLDGRGIDYPHVTGADVTHRRAQRARTAGPEAMELFGQSEGGISRE